MERAAETSGKKPFRRVTTLAWRKGGLFSPVLATVFGLILLAYGFVALCDPFDLRPWGLKVQLEDHPYPDVATPKLMLAMAKGNYDLVVVGASTTMGFTPRMMRQAFPDAAKPFDFAVAGMDAKEAGMVLDTLLKHDRALKRVIIGMDTIVIDGPRLTATALPHYYDARWYEFAPEFGPEAIEASWNVLSRGVLTTHGWVPRGDLPNHLAGRKSIADQPDLMATFKANADRTRPYITNGPEPPCASFPGIADILEPFVKKASAQGIEVDVLLPPFALSVYSDWLTRWQRESPRWAQNQGLVYGIQIALRQCTVKAMDGLAHVRVHGFDTDFATTAHLSNYHDSVHMIVPARYQEVLNGIAAGDHVLTVQNFDAYDARLKAAVQAFTPQP